MFGTADSWFGYFMGVGLVWFTAWWTNPSINHGTTWFIAVIVGLVLGDTTEIRYKLKDWEEKYGEQA